MLTIFWGVLLYSFAPLIVESSLDGNDLPLVFNFTRKLKEELDALQYPVETDSKESNPEEEANNPDLKLQQTIEGIAHNFVAQVSKLNKMAKLFKPELFSMEQSQYHPLSFIPEIDTQLSSLEGSIKKVEILWKDFNNALENRVNMYTWLQDFANNITSSDAQVYERIINPFSAVVNFKPKNNTKEILKNTRIENNHPGTNDEQTDTLPMSVVKKTKRLYSELCDMKVTPHEFLYDLYQTIAITDKKAFTMLHFSYALLNKLNPVDWSLPPDNQMDQLNLAFESIRKTLNSQERIKKYLNVFKDALLSTPRTLRRCETKAHFRGQTFLEFERFINTVIVEEPALNPARSCRGSCRVSAEGKMFMEDEDLSKICTGSKCQLPSRICHGSVIECKNIGWDVEFCENNDDSNARSYDWFRNEEGIVHGDNSTGCKGTLRHADLFRKALDVRCEVCACTCVEDKQVAKMETLIDMRDVVSDQANNQVVTGVKFIREQRVIRIQILTGKLIENGEIDPDTVQWQVMKTLTDEEKKSRAHRGLEPAFKPNWSHRTINLDEINVPDGYVITGVRFVEVEQTESNEHAIGLEVRATGFDYRTGKLDEDNTVWIGPGIGENDPEAYNSAREEVHQSTDLKNPLAASKTLETIIPDFKSNKWIRLEKTGLKEDAGQTVIPLLDALPVYSEPAVPLSGINLFHKSAEGYGGFLSFQIMSIDRTNHLDYDKCCDGEDSKDSNNNETVSEDEEEKRIRRTE